MNERDKNIISKIIGAAVIVFIIVLIGMTIIPPPNQTLDSIIKDINVKTVSHGKGMVDIGVKDPRDVLPDISKYPLRVNSGTPSYIEIFSSPEKAGSGTDGWLAEVARDFNNAAITIDGKRASVMLREIASGDGADYITSGKYLPDAYTPSNELWGKLIISKGVKAQLMLKRLAGNVAGILITKAKRDELTAKYGAVNIKTVVDAVTANELQMGYTNPLASSTGLNFLISALQTFDSSDPLSNKAIAGFRSFQANVPVVAYTTLQMREAAKSGALDGFILEYQTYLNTPEIKSYEFIPFGIRHDSPIYAIGELPADKMKILSKFIEFAQQDKYQTLATRYGFNGLDDYQPKTVAISGDVIIQAQNLWKENKDTGKPICAVFVADVSGSMAGEPLNRLKKSLLMGQNNIGKNNLIGLISYSNDVNIDLPISKFDLNQRAKFAGAVNDLQEGGSTSTFDAIAVAMKMLADQKAAGPDADPNLKPKIFVLSDGETNTGHSLSDIRQIVKDLGIPIYTIGYNANIPALQEIANINEAACINADNDDVAYKLGKLFDAETSQEK